MRPDFLQSGAFPLQATILFLEPSDLLLETLVAVYKLLMLISNLLQMLFMPQLL